MTIITYIHNTSSKLTKTVVKPIYKTYQKNNTYVRHCVLLVQMETKLCNTRDFLRKKACCKKICIRLQWTKENRHTYMEECVTVDLCRTGTVQYIGLTDSWNIANSCSEQLVRVCNLATYKIQQPV